MINTDISNSFIGDPSLNQTYNDDNEKEYNVLLIQSNNDLKLLSQINIQFNNNIQKKKISDAIKNTSGKINFLDNFINGQKQIFISNDIHNKLVEHSKSDLNIILTLKSLLPLHSTYYYVDKDADTIFLYNGSGIIDNDTYHIISKIKGFNGIFYILSEHDYVNADYTNFTRKSSIQNKYLKYKYKYLQLTQSK